MSSVAKSWVKMAARVIVSISLVCVVFYLVPIAANQTSPLKASMNNWANEISAMVAKVGADQTIAHGEYDHCEAIDKELRLYISPDETVDHDVLTFAHDPTFSLGFLCWIVLLACRLAFSKATLMRILCLLLKASIISALAFGIMLILRDIAFGALVAIKGVRVIALLDNYVRMAIILMLAGIILLPSWSVEMRSK